MRRFETLLTLLCFFALLFSVASAIDYGTLSGLVSWEGGYGSISDSKIIIYSPSGELFDSTFTDNYGWFRIDLPAGDYLVSAEKENLVKEFYPSEYLIKEADKVKINVGQMSGLSFGLDFGGWISGNFAYLGEDAQMGLVTAIKIDEPNEGWHKSVRLYGPFPSAYDIAGLLPGTYKILGRARGKSTEYYPGVERFEDATAIPITRDVGVSHISFNLDQVGWGFIEGQVADLATGEGIENIPVYAFQWLNYWEDPNLMTARTGSDGRYVLNVPAGCYYLFTSYPDVNHGDGDVAIYYNNHYDPSQADIIEVFENQTFTGIDFLVDYSTPHNLTISGVVINERTGEGLNSIVVTAIELTSGTALGSAFSANEGNYTINGLASGQYLLMFSGPHIIPYFYSNSDSWQQAEIITLTGHFGTIRSEAITQDYGHFGLAISGRVVSDNGPLGGARVYAYHDNDTQPTSFAWTNSSGEYCISTGLVSGWYTIKCDLFGYDSKTYPDAIYLDLSTNPEENDIDFHLVRPGTAVASAKPGAGEWIIKGNYPNPFNSGTSIMVFSGLDIESQSEINVYNIVGQLVGRKNVTLYPGENIIRWYSEDFKECVTSGVYFYKFADTGSTYRMIFLK